MRHIVVKISLGLGLATSACPASILSCGPVLATGPIQFGEVYDRFLHGTPPDPDEVKRTRWQLKGIASGPKDPWLGWASRYEATGYLVNDAIPELEFVGRQRVQEEGRHRNLLSINDGDLFAIRRNWGVREAVIDPVAVHRAEYPGIHNLMLGSLAMYLPLYDHETGPELFLDPQHSLSFSSSLLYLQCRRERGALICMGQLLRPYSPATLAAPLPITDFLWFEPRP
jgi:hypothetical protein